MTTTLDGKVPEFNVSVTFRHTESTEALMNYTQEKINHVLQKYVRYHADIHVILSVEKRDHKAELTMLAKNYDLRAEATTGDLYSAIDKLADNLHTQLRKQKEKMTEHKAPPAAEVVS